MGVQRNVPSLQSGLILLHPSLHIFSHALLEGIAESRVVAVTAVLSQLLDGERLPCGDNLAIESHEMVDAQPVDIAIVCDVLLREILAKIEPIGANGLG